MILANIYTNHMGNLKRAIATVKHVDGTVQTYNVKDYYVGQKSDLMHLTTESGEEIIVSTRNVELSKK